MYIGEKETYGRNQRIRWCEYGNRFDDRPILINAEKNDMLIKMQKDLVNLLTDYNEYVKSKYQDYEKNFKPHITVAMDLKEAQFCKAKQDFKDDFQCIGAVEEIVLSVVKEITPSESKNPDNLTIYNL
ncbi:MAG: hypothetical protein ACD_58C00306G0006 [uncultured bacterium]|nr:MAG: hypothetical protein ACD_58C00306G0006 [uncultured bacterium]